MLIAVILILGLLYFINRSFLEQKTITSDPNKASDIVINNQHSNSPEILDPNDLANYSQADDLTSNQNYFDNENPLDETTALSSNQDLAYYDVPNTEIGNEPAPKTKKPIVKEQNNPVKKDNVQKKRNDDTIGNLIKEIDSNGTSARSKSPSKSYKIQAGSYKTETEANRQKARLIMLNVPSDVVKVNLNGVDYYRVISSSKVSKEEANKIKSTLKTKSIDSFLISQ